MVTGGHILGGPRSWSECGNPLGGQEGLAEEGTAQVSQEIEEREMLLPAEM